ncbi:MAG: hypothetical protein K9K88_14820 [Desulfobacterales bacterium]|nr:hypothetical protein [Desulfobacterales bacterium]
MRHKRKSTQNRLERLRKKLAGTPGIGRVFKKRCRSDASSDPGVVIVKIDGLSHRQIQRAFERGRLPNLRRLVEKDGFLLKPLYSGMPSSTPAVQGELFYGVKSSVPAISFYDRSKEKKFNLLLPGSAGEMARRLEKQGEPLLKAGSSYSNIYTGGADEARYCTQTMSLRSVRHLASSVKLFVLLAVQPAKFFRMLGYGILEAGLAFYDFIRGVGEGKNVFKELKFIPTRVFLCILLRELIRTRAKMDVRRGVRIVHASFLGYDEQAHRRGPDSGFAHWTLKGIDDAIEDIYRTALLSECRRYRLIVYADHGQEAVVPYERHTGKPLEKVVGQVIDSAAPNLGKQAAETEWGGGRFFNRRTQGLLFKNIAPEQPEKRTDVDRFQITVLGPFGHIYLFPPPGPQKKAQLAEALANEGKIPLVLYVSNGDVMAVNRNGKLPLQDHAEALLGAAHPFANQTAEDLARACRHPNAGDLVISGWTPEEKPITFAGENGSHGGPGKEETAGFVILPPELAGSETFMRPLDLRSRVFQIFDAGDIESDDEPVETRRRK